MKFNKSLVFRILKIVFSVILSLAVVFCALAATAINGVRAHFSSEEFYEQVKETDLEKATFTVNGENVTVSDYVFNCAEDYLGDKIPSYFPFANMAIEAVLSLEAVDKAVKEELLFCVDYFLNSDSDEAEKRIKSGVDTFDNEELDPKNADNPAEAVKVFVRSFVLANVEKNTGVSCDKIIVLLSEKTATNLIIMAVAAAVLLLVINLRTVFNLLLYSGAGAFVYGTVITALQSKYFEAADGNEELIGFCILNPLVEAFSPKATAAFVIGAVLTALFIGFYFIFKKFVNNEKTP